MPFFAIAGDPYDVRLGASFEKEHVGESVRAFSGKLRSSKRDAKLKMSIDLAPMSLSSYTTLYNATKLGAQVTVSGDALGSSITAEVVIDKTDYIHDGASDFKVLLSLTILEA